MKKSEISKGIYILPILLVLAFLSCNKMPPKQDISTNARSVLQTLGLGDTPTVYNAVVLSINQKLTPNDSGYQVSASGVFIDSATGHASNVTGLSINSRALARGSDSTYSFSYSDSNTTIQSEGMALAGTTVKVKVTGVSAGDTVTTSVYMPKTITRYSSDLTKIFLNVLNDQPVTWTPDPSNPNGQVNIQLKYSAKLSQYLSGDNTLPATDNTLSYTVPDNGSYTIPSSALQVFKNNSYVWLSLGRGAQAQAILPVSHQNVYFFTAASGTTNILNVLCAANWQNTSTPLRCKAGSTTGEQEQEQKDVSVCSSTYNQTRWMAAGTNLTACPACNSSNCLAPSHKCINGACQTGTLQAVSYVQQGSKCVITYGYVFSDGTYNFDHSTTRNGPCQF